MKLSILHKLSLGTVFLVLVSAGVVGWLFYSRTTNLLVEHALEDIAADTSNAGSILQAHIEAQQADTLFLSNTPPIQGMLRAQKAGNYDKQGKSTYRQWVQRLQSIFATVLKSKPAYLKLRFIDRNGQELVVVGHENGKIVLFSGAQLQNKVHRRYVSGSLQLPAGGVYLSEINLNREHGKVSEPHREVLRSASPVYDEHNGEVAGLLLITAEIGRELRKIQNSIHGVGGNIYISNDRGGYLLHPDASKSYGFDLGKRYRIQEDLPRLAQRFLPDNQEMQVTLLPEKRDSGLVVNFTKIPFDATHPERFIAVTMTQDYESIVAEQSSVLNDMKLWALYLAMGATGLAIVLSIRITQPIKQMTRAVDDFAHQRVTTATLPVKLGDEIGVLARSFDTMIHQVEETQDNLRELNDNLEVQIADRTRSLEQSEAQQRTILEAIADAVITIDEKGLITSFNPAAEKTFGYHAGEVIGQNVAVLMAKDERQAHHEYTNNSTLHVARIINQARDLAGLRKDKSLFPLELNVAPLQGKVGSGFVGILRDITDRLKAEQALLNAKEDAESANRAKSEFLSSMSHELRTPMNAIMGFSQLLMLNSDQPLNETQRENVNEIYKAGKHLLELINEVLDLARIEAGHIDLSIETVDLGEVVAESLQIITPLAQKRGIEISLSHNDVELKFDELLQQDLTVRADHTRLKQVLLNLLSNAVKYNCKNGKLIIACDYSDGNQIRISVTDTGEGLSQEQQTLLFKPFERLGTDKADIEGTGIGLVITKNIIELMGGCIGVDSKQGEGSTFWIEVPSDTLHPAQKKMAAGMKSTDQQNITKPEREHTMLYIEDNPANLRLVAQLLGGRPNIHMWSAHEPLLGLDLAAEHKPDLILLDINLPGMDGFEVLKRLRQQEAIRNTPVIAISANAMPRDIERGLAAGFDDYITKPVDMHALLKAIDTALLEKK